MADPETLSVDQVRQRIQTARDEISRLCTGRGKMTRGGLAGRSWTMCIPRREDDSDAVFGALADATDALLIQLVDTTQALERAYRFAWAHGRHRAPCPLAADINAPDGTPCSCGYDADAGVLMDDEERLGFEFWADARPAHAGAATTEGGATSDE